MTADLAHRIREWIEAHRAGCMEHGATVHFEEGLALLGMVMNNIHYLASIRRKGPVNGMRALVYELGKRVSGFKFQVSSFKLPAEKENKDFKEVKEGVASAAPRNDGGLNESNTETRNPKPATRNGFILREEFPFLGQKDCPDELKVLVADMITSHKNYVEGHERLYYVVDKSNEECYRAAEAVVENYLNNRMIWEELETYKKTGRVLGVHPAFERFSRRKEIEEMGAEQLMKEYRTLPRNIARAKKMIKDNKDSEANKDRMDRIVKQEEDLKMVKRIMGVTKKPHPNPPQSGGLKKRRK